MASSAEISELLFLGFAASLAVTASTAENANRGMALGIASRTQPPHLDVWRQVPGPQPFWVIHRSDGSGGISHDEPPPGESVGPPWEFRDEAVATGVLADTLGRLRSSINQRDHHQLTVLENAMATCANGFAETWLRDVFSNQSTPGETSWASLATRAQEDFGACATNGTAASVVILSAALAAKTDDGPLAAGMMGLLHSMSAFSSQPFGPGDAVWALIRYVVARNGFESTESTTRWLLEVGDEHREAALDEDSTLQFGAKLRDAALFYGAADLAGMAALDLDVDGIVTDSFRKLATVADERNATVHTAIGRWALGYDGSEFHRDRSIASAMRLAEGEQAAERFVDRLIERTWFHPRAARSELLAEPGSST